MSALAQKVRSAVLWNAGFNVFRDVLQFGLMLVLVRILAPEAYGHFAFVSSLIAFLSIFSLNLFVAHTLQVRNDAATNYQDHFTTGAVLSVALAVLANIVAIGLRASDEYAVVAPLVHVMSINFLLDWPTQFYCRMLEREMDFRRLRTLHAIGVALVAAGSIAMALFGFGAYSLLVPTMAVTLPFLYDLFVRRGWRPTWQWSWQRYEPALRFGLARIGSGLMLSGRQLLESGTLSASLGFTALGFINRAIGLASISCYKIASQLFEAIYPALTRLDGGPENARRVAGLVLCMVAWMVIPAAVVFGVLAHPVVHTIYGEKWTDVAPLLPWAMAWAAAAALQHTAYMLLLAQQQPRKCLAADVLTLAGTAGGLLGALPYGIAAYLIVLAGVQLALFVLLMIWLCRCEAVDWTAGIMAIGPAAAAAALATAGSAAVFDGLFQIRPNTFVGALFWGMLFGVLYLAILRIAFAPRLAALVAYLPGRRVIRQVLVLRT